MSAYLKLTPCDSLAELHKHLAKATHSLLVGGESEAPRGFFIINVAAEAPLMIGLCSSGVSPRQRVLWQAEQGRVLIGSDCTVTSVDAQTGKIIANVRLDGAFFDFLLPDDNGATIVHELGALGIGFDGAVRWSVSSDDVVENFRVETGRILELDVVDTGRPLRVSLSEGSVLDAE